MKALRLMPALALGLSGCPGDDTGGTGTDSNTDPTMPSTSGDPTGNPTSATGTSSTTQTPTTDMTTEMTSDGTTAATGEESSGSTGGGLACPYTPVKGDPAFSLELVADGFSQGLLTVGHPVDTDTLYVVQKGGQIKEIAAGVTEAPMENWAEFAVAAGGEGGLLGLAFHPDFENDPRIYVAATQGGADQGALVVTEYMVGDAGPDMGSARRVIGAGQQADNHNGGMIHFGPDGMLYVSVGDGGTQNDGCQHGQSGDTFLGKILRIDVEADGTPDEGSGCRGGGGGCDCSAPTGFDYTIPPDNPFVGDANVLDAIYSIGWRNPWRFSIDPIDDSIWVSDVGQQSWEEVTVIVEAGDNAGWGDMEGAHCNNAACDDTAAPGTINADGYRMPVIEYQNQGNFCSITGLGNYRSCEVPEWDGRYFYGDLCTGVIYAVSFDGAVVTDHGQVGQIPDGSLFGGGYNAYGDVYVTPSSTFGGTFPIYRIAPGE